MIIKQEKSRVFKIACITTDIGEFRVWDHGSIDMWDDDSFEWVSLPDHISMIEEAMIRAEGLRKMREVQQ